MSFEFPSQQKFLPTNCTDEFPTYIGMKLPFMRVQMNFLSEVRVTHAARIRLFASMYAQVVLKMLFNKENFGTHCAREFLSCNTKLLMCHVI